MADAETTGSNANLTGGKTTQESKVESTEPAGVSEGLPEGAKNYQHALQLAREREKQKEEELAEIKSKLDEVKAEEKRRKLAEMNETERFKAVAEEETQKRGKLEMKLVVQEALAGKEVPKPVKDMLLNSPWSIPAVADELGDIYSWDDAIASVKKHLPVFVDSLTAGSKETLPSENLEVRKVDTERSTGSTVVREHYYTPDEVTEIAKDAGEWEKHRLKIFKQMEQNKGKI